YLDQDAAVLADRAIRQAYKDLKRGLEIPDAHYLAPYVPNYHKRAVTEVDINRKTEQLRPLQLRCDINIEKVEPKVVKGAHGLPAVKAVLATIAVRWSSANAGEHSTSGIQVWRLKNGRWV